MKGLSVHTLRVSKWEKEGYDGSLGGASSKYDQFVLIGAGVAEVFTPNESQPALRLVKRMFLHKAYYHAEPIEQPIGMIGPMFGGNYITSGDSRMPQEVIPVHDRWETKEQYASNY